MIQTDHDRLIRIDENVTMILQRMAKYDDNQVAQDQRIGKIEQFQSKILGVAGGISIIISVIWSHFSGLFGGSP